MYDPCDTWTCYLHKHVILHILELPLLPAVINDTSMSKCYKQITFSRFYWPFEHYKNQGKAYNCLISTHNARTRITQSRFWALKFVIQKQKTEFFFLELGLGNIRSFLRWKKKTISRYFCNFPFFRNVFHLVINYSVLVTYRSLIENLIGRWDLSFWRYWH